MGTQQRTKHKDALPSRAYIRTDPPAPFGCERLTIQSGGTLNGLFLREGLFDYVDIVVAPVLVGGKNGMIAGCLQNGTVLCRTGLSQLMVDPLAEADIFNGLFNPITRVENKFIIVRDAEGQQIYNTFVYGCANMIVCEDSGVLAVNIGSDNIGSRMAQLVMHSGEMTVINAMRYNGISYEHYGGTLRLYNRLTIENKKEQTYIEQK